MYILFVLFNFLGTYLTLKTNKKYYDLPDQLFLILLKLTKKIKKFERKKINYLKIPKFELINYLFDITLT